MKKIFVIALLSIFSFGYSQSGIGINAQQNKEVLSFPTSPDAYSFDKVGKLPMDLFNGKANISIPIYDIQLGDLVFPIKLSYNTGGIKQNEISSSVGLGWSLSIPNTISKNIMGKDDDFFPIYFKDYNTAYQYSSIDPWNDNAKKEVLGFLYDGMYDVQPDLFSYNLPTVNGSFIINNNKGFPVPHEDVLIQRLPDNGSFTITDSKGNKFWLSGKNSVMTKRSQTVAQLAVNSFLMDSLRTSRNQGIQIEYQKKLNYSEESKFESRILTSQNAPVGYTPFPPIQTSPPPRIDINTNFEKLITKITFPEGQIEFKYSGDENLTTVGEELYRKDIKSSAGIALKRIVVKDKSGKIVKDFLLNHSYFESSSVDKTYEDYRLKLIGLKDNLQNKSYAFSYNENTPLPARNSNNDDYWGYFNNTFYSKSNTSIPDQIFSSNIGASQSTIIGGRNRNTNPNFAQLGVLTAIKYPTGASKNLYYESNTIETTQYSTIDAYESYMSIGNNQDPGTFVKPIRDTLVTVPQSVFMNKPNARFKITFGNGCMNNNDDIAQIHENRCKGSINMSGQVYTSNGKSFTAEFGATTSPIQLRLQRIGDCGCDFSFNIKYNKQIATNLISNVGGLRIKKVEDVDAGNTSNIYNYSYERADPNTGVYKGSGKLKRPFQFVKSFYRVAHPSVENAGASDYIQRDYMVQNTGSAYNSYSMSNIVTYSTVKEYNDLGETIYEFADGNAGVGSVYSDKTGPYDDWRYGLPLKTTYKKGANILKEETFKYDINPLKNKLSGYNPVTNEEIAFGLDLDIVPYNVENFNVPPLSSYQVNMSAVEIYGGKIERKKSTVTEYFEGGKKVENQTVYTYSDTDINKPINLKSTLSTFSSGENVVTDYQYAHEKGIQKLINANIIDTPIETQVTKKQNANDAAGKVLSRTETKYDNPLTLLPSSALSYDLQNNPTTEVTYDQYDSKGNLKQYTTKDGISTVIVWGYNQTQPIAKIEGAKLTDIQQSLIDSIVNASNTDALAGSSNDETTFLSALNTFRANTALSAYQITTFTYDPLVGVRSITPPSGIRESYVYDSANRLQKVIDVNGKVLKEMKYNYKN
ncbi:hypothetical protein [Chryseobacterium indologenes]|uniref:hypothetical protein n=1 Tax=Chryseobacterium indologenes TaxID=253 RepID=UPI0011AB6150|nr:hypothetical protein [Chryseobacterium indologenes]